MTNEEKDIILALKGTAHINTLVPNKAVIKLIWIIEKQQKEIKRLKDYEDIEWNEFNELSKLYKEIEKKDKIIDLMANYIYAVDYRNECGKTRVQVKQYFEKEAENED